MQGLGLQAITLIDVGGMQVGSPDGQVEMAGVQGCCDGAGETAQQPSSEVLRRASSAAFPSEKMCNASIRA